MAFSVQMPALGESVTEGTVTRWLKQEGDTVEVDEPLVEVSTDKVDTEIPSPAAGVLQKIVAQEDETIEVGAELAVIGDGSGCGDSGLRRRLRSDSGGDVEADSGGDVEAASGGDVEAAPEASPRPSRSPSRRPSPSSGPSPRRPPKSPLRTPAARARR